MVGLDSYTCRDVKHRDIAASCKVTGGSFRDSSLRMCLVTDLNRKCLDGDCKV